MKKVILHVGYPKTGTTSLQNGLFLNLKNEINYLGIAKAHFSDYHHLLRRTLQPWILNAGKEGIKELNLLLTDRLSLGINLLSEEGFINSQNKPGPPIEPSEIQKILESKCDSIEVVIVIRNQVELIYAIYANGGLIDKYGNILNTNNYIDMCLNDKNYRSFFNFADVIKRYKIVFGDDNVHVLFFEDFLYDKNEYFSKWSKILCVPEETLLETIGDLHLHKKQKTSDGSYIFKMTSEPNKFIKFIKRMPMIQNIFSKFSIFKFIKKNISLLADKRVDKELIVKLFNDEEKRRIKKSFLNDNLMLLEVIKSNKKKLKKYNYL